MKTKYNKLQKSGKKILAVVLALGVVASIGYFGVNSVLADDDNPMHNTLISRIAQKFNLKEDDVKAVFEAVRDEHQEQMKKDREESLSKAVSDGVITEKQKQAILVKMDENMGLRNVRREEMRSWFLSQGIDETKLRDYLGPKDGRGPRGN